MKIQCARDFLSNEKSESLNLLYSLAMEDEEKYSKKSLLRFSYRYLQQLAKSMCLPSNFKKVYLVELIRAKKFSSESEVKSIVQRVKRERQQLAEFRKNYNDYKNDKMCYKKPQSPPITTTPKRTGISVRCSPNLCQAINKYKQKSNLPHISQKMTTSPKIQNGSDRVLRSFNLRTKNKKGVSYVSNVMIGVIQAQRSSPEENRIGVVSYKDNISKFNVTARCLVKKHKTAILDSSNDNCNGMYENRQLHTKKVSTPAVKRQRTVSGIYPLVPKEPTKYGYLQSIGLRGRDGKIAKIQALVQKRSTCAENYEKVNIRKPEIHFQDIVSCKINPQTLANSNLIELFKADSNINNNYLQLPCPKHMETEIENNIQASNHNLRLSEPNEDIHSVYYHKKIRAEQVRCSRFLNTREHFVEESLPKFNDAFTQFRDVLQPLYVQVSDSETVDMHQVHVSRSSANCGMLESIYNIRTQYLFNQPFLQIATTSNTKCVFSTPTIATPKAQPSSTFIIAESYMASGEPFGGSSRVTPLYAQESASPDTSASIPEMVEDALEIISQDGDYMERIGMDVRIQCMLCSWAGPAVMLEYHIKRDHSNQIYRQNSNEWSTTFTLGSLVQCQLYLSQIVEYESTLYVLSARYEDPDCFMASMCTLASEPNEQRIGSITTYNKVTGEPHSWQGHIQPLQTFESRHFQINNDCLKLELSQLNLLPNSANLKLLNRELVNDSPYKVVVGQPELNDIHIILSIKILD